MTGVNGRLQDIARDQMPNMPGKTVSWSEVMAGEVLGFLFPLQASRYEQCEQCEHERYLKIMKYHEVLETFGDRCCTTALQTEQSLCTFMHIQTRQNK